MSAPTYSQPGFPVLLGKQFRNIVNGGRPPAQACEILTLLLRNRAFETVPPLPDGWRLTLVDGQLKVEAMDGTLTDAGEYLYQPTRPVLAHFRQARGEVRETPANAAAVLDEIENSLKAPLRQALRASKPHVSRRGRKAYDVWQPMFDHLDELVKQRGRPFVTFTEAAGFGLEFLQQLARQRRKAGQGAAIPTLKTIQEKIADQRPDLVVD